MKILKPERFIYLLVLVCMANLNAQDWPQFLGPERNSTSPQKNIYRSWPENGPDVLWTAEVGIGFGGPVVKGGKVYLLDREDEVGDMMRCFDLSNGEELWSFKYEATGSVMFPGSRSVPTVDESHIYSCGHNGDLYCIDINTQRPIWNRNIWTDFGGGELPMWAISQCPLIYRDLLILASQAPEAGVVAYDKRTGDVKWATPPLGEVGYVSPAIVKVNGEDHVVMITASARGGEELGKIVGMDPLSGEVLWEYTDWECSIPVPSAIDAGDNKVLVIGGYERGATMIRVEKNADGIYSTTELFTTREFGDQTKPAILHKGEIF